MTRNLLSKEQNIGNMKINEYHEERKSDLYGVDIPPEAMHLSTPGLPHKLVFSSFCEVPPLF